MAHYRISPGPAGCVCGSQGCHLSVAASGQAGQPGESGCGPEHLPPEGGDGAHPSRSWMVPAQVKVDACCQGASPTWRSSSCGAVRLESAPSLMVGTCCKCPHAHSYPTCMEYKWYAHSHLLSYTYLHVLQYDILCTSCPWTLCTKCRRMWHWLI